MVRVEEVGIEQLGRCVYTAHEVHQHIVWSENHAAVGKNRAANKGRIIIASAYRERNAHANAIVHLIRRGGLLVSAVHI